MAINDKFLKLQLGVETNDAKSNLRDFYDDFSKKMVEMGATKQEVGFFAGLVKDVESGKVAITEFDVKTQKLIRTFQQGRDVSAARDFLGVPAHAQVRDEIDKTRAAYDTLKKSGQLTGSELAQAALKTDEKIRQLNASTSGLAESLGNAKGALAGLVGSAAGITAVVREAVQFEEAMSDVAKVVDGSDEQIAGLSKGIRELSQELPISADGLAQMAAAGGQLGIPIEQLEKFITISAKMATAFGLDAEQAGQAMAKLMNVFGLSLDQVEQLGDSINVLGNTTAAREGDIVEFLVRVGGSAKQFGLAADQASALGTALISLGTAPQVAANGVNALLSKLQTANVQGEAFQEGLAAIGVSAEKLAADIKANPQEALQTFLKTLEKLDGQSRAEVLTKLFGLEYQDDISRLVGSLGLYEKALAEIGNKATVAGAMNREFEKRMQTTAAQLDLLKNAVEAAAINLGTVFLPVVNKLISPLTGAAEALGDFTSEFPQIAALAATLGTLLASVTALKLGFGALSVVGHQAVDGLADKWTAAKLPIADATKEVGKLNLALSGVSALMVGWDIGTYLRDNFEIARVAGVAMTESLVKGAEYVQYAWEAAKAVYTNDTVDAATARHEARLAKITRLMDDLYLEAERGAAGQEALGKAGTQAGDKLAEGQKVAQAAIAETGKAAKTLDEDLKLLGIEPGQFADMEVESAAAFTRIASNAKATGDQILTALVVTLDKVSSQAAPDLEFALQDAFQAGRLSADQLAAGVDAISTKAAGLWAEMDKGRDQAGRLAEAYKTLGITSQAALDESARSARNAFQIIRDSGAGADILKAAWEKYAQAAIAANGGIADASIKAEAAMYGYTVTVDQAGKATLKAMNDAAEATRGTGDAARGAAGGYRELAASAEDAYQAAEKLRHAQAEANRQAGGSQTWEQILGAGFNLLSSEQQDAFIYRYQTELLPRILAVAQDGRSINTNAADGILRDVRAQIDSLAKTRAAGVDAGTAPPQSTTHRVVIQLPSGRSDTINLVSSSDAQTLSDLLKQLQMDMARS